ncbi:MAG: SCO family protein [Candidatus Thiodiazotropha sp. (ex Lucinoma kastoroae)]|nr:SCO family protein [Candidatus Thiodiazotropha sp. (ex Lucinoma kastoroae)]MCU7859626.1 SCO family protein [Candidatus Thiodiazotropha sp. (ex Lucinoma kastoroae)]
MFRITLFIITLLITFSSTASDEVSQQDEILDLNGTELGGDFTLHSSQGEFSLEQLRGKVVLLYFGYTKCPDVCPASLAFLTQALNELSDDELKAVQGVFISVDPKRDNFQVLDDYVSYFHPNLMGVTGNDIEIAKVAKLYGAQYYEVALEGSAFGYAVNHSAVTYLITPEGELRFVFPHQTPSSVILEAIQYVLAGN